MHTQIHVGLKIILITMVFVACSNPEREANKLFTEASRLLREASTIEGREPYVAFAKRIESRNKLERIVQKCPSSSIALEYSKGNLQLNGKNIDEAFPEPNIFELFTASADENNFERVKALVEYQQKVENNNLGQMLSYSVRQGYLSYAKFLVSNGADIDDGGLYIDPILISAKYGEVDSVRWLIEKGVKIDKSDNRGTTPLLWAVKEGHTEVARLLVQSGAKVNKEDDEGKTPLYVAASRGNHEIVKLLLLSGAKVNTYIGNGWPTLKGLVWEDPIKNNGYSPLMIAASNGHLEVVQALLSAGADPNFTDGDKRKASDISLQYPMVNQILKRAEENL